MQLGEITGMGRAPDWAGSGWASQPLLFTPGGVRDRPQKLAFHQDRFFLYHRELQLTRLQYWNNLQYLLISQPRLSVTYTTEASCTFFHNLLLVESTSVQKLSCAPTWLRAWHAHKSTLRDRGTSRAVPRQRNHTRRKLSTNFKFLSAEITAQMFQYLLYL